MRSRRELLRYAGLFAAATACGYGLSQLDTVDMTYKTARKVLAELDKRLKYNMSIEQKIEQAVARQPGLEKAESVLNPIPSVYAQTSGRIIQAGIEQYPVDLENPISKDEIDKDTIDNVYPVFRSSEKNEGHLYVKRDSEFTKFIADFPTSVLNPYGFTFKLIFDTENSKSEETGAKGVYNLYLESNSTRPPTEGSSRVGIPFSRDFHKGEHYGWRYFFASSSLSSTPHVQIKAEFKTDILLRSDNASREILIYNSFSDHKGVLEFPDGTILRFVDETVAEPLGTGATITSLGFAVYIAHRIQKYRVAG